MFLRNIPVQITKGHPEKGVSIIPKATGEGKRLRGRSGLAQWAEGQEGGVSHSIFGENTERMRQAGPGSEVAALCPLPVGTGGRRTPGGLSRWRSACGRAGSGVPGTRGAQSAAGRDGPGAPGPWLSPGGPAPASVPGSLAALGKPGETRQGDEATICSYLGVTHMPDPTII